jgi:hypothetical protein
MLNEKVNIMEEYYKIKDERDMYKKLVEADTELFFNIHQIQTDGAIEELCIRALALRDKKR